jgi:protein phosphatase
LTEKHRILKAGSTINAEGRIDGNLNLSRALGDLAYKKRPNLKPQE